MTHTATRYMVRESWPTWFAHLYLLLDDFGQEGAGEHVILKGSPVSATVEKNAFNEADAFEATFDLDDFPFDPRIIRGASIELFVGDAGGVETWWDHRSSDEMRELCIFAGVVDLAEATLDDDGRRVKLKGRDYTALFLDVEIEAGEILWTRSGEPLSLDQILEELIAARSATKALRLVKRGTIPALYPARYKRRGADETTGTRRSREGETAWDVMQEIALEAGCLLYVDLDEVVLAEPRTLFLGEDGTSSVDPDSVWCVTVGDDVSSLRLARQLGRQHGIGVQVTSFDADTGTTLRAFSPQSLSTDTPKRRKRQGKASSVGSDDKRPEDADERQNVRPFVVRGITDQAQLQRIADQLAAQLRHHETEAAIATDAMRDSRGRPFQRIRYGDPIVIDYAESLDAHLVKPIGEQVSSLVSAGYSRADAEKFSGVLQKMRVPFYVHRAIYRGSTSDDGGFSIEIEARARKQVEG